jgi:hypothetical protein
MATNLVLLSGRAGIQRDGTNFQGDYYLDGQWIRFQRGIPKKIGGMKAPNLFLNATKASNILMIPQDNGNIYVYISDIHFIRSGIITRDFNFQTDRGNMIVDQNNVNLQWYSEIVTYNNQRYVVFLGTNNGTNIFQNTASTLYHNTLFNNGNVTAVNIPPLINGGMCFVAPYLFLYGSNGLVLHSKSNNPFDFTVNANDPATGGSYNISNDKVIYGTSTRGGPNNLSLLFWTVSSLISLTNVGNATVLFRKYVISTDISILSSRCVVEYDGLFFWVGTDGFYLYNGLVERIPNNLSLNYFFNNLDMNQRQKVFGEKNPKYNEITWFYPVIGTVGNSKSITYNLELKTWYDSNISRDCGFYFKDLGIFATYGQSLTAPNANTYLWRHEYQINEQVEGGFDTPIISSFTTPVFSWAAFNPVRNANNTRNPIVDRWTELRRIEPNFLMDNDNDQISVSVNIKKYAQTAPVTTPAITFTRLTEKLDMRVQGRNLSLTFSSGGNFELGNTILTLGIGDGQ